MTSNEDRRSLERFVAGLDVDEDALAAAVTARAVDRTIVVEALLAALASPLASVRRRAAQRVARMDDVAPRIAAELTLIAGADPDERVREAGVTALRAHDLLVPGGPAEPGTARSRGAPAARSIGAGLLASLWMRPMTMRSAQPVLLLLPRNRAGAPETRGRVTDDEDGSLLIVLSGLPEQFAGHRPTVRVQRDPQSDAYTAIGTAAEPVTEAGVAMIRIDRDVGPVDEIRRWLSRDIEVIVP